VIAVEYGFDEHPCGPDDRHRRRGVPLSRNTTLTTAFGTPVGHVGAVALRRAVIYIDTHAGESITLLDIATSAGASARALQHAFAQHHDTTPPGYLRSRFSAFYRRTYGVSPGHTLRT
jgi:hypothetical protein